MRKILYFSACLTALMVFLLLVGNAVADSPQPLPANIVAAWEKAGAQFFWMASSGLRDPDANGQSGDIPAFYFRQWPADFSQLPQPDQSFGILSGGIKIPDSGLEELSGFVHLTKLVLIDTQITDAGLKGLSSLTHLQTLNLYGSSVSDAGLEGLAGLTQLQTLVLDNTQVTDAGMKQLAGLKQLHVLTLSNTKMTDAGLMPLAGLEQLQILNLNSTHVTDVGLQQLASLKH